MINRVIIRQAWDRDGYNIWLMRESELGKQLVEPFTLKLREPVQSDAFLLPEPSVFLRTMEFQSMRKSFEEEMIANGWSKDRAALEGELKATEKHLDDMRKLTFSFRGIK